MANFCKCGCRQVIPAGNTYVRGHHWRVLRAQAGIPDTKTCERCGCTYARESIGSRQSNIHWMRRQFCGETCRRENVAEIAAAASGELAAQWLGDEAKENSGRMRARRLYPVAEPCEVCGSKRSERHHIDTNTLNNDRSNIAFLCRKHHMEAEQAMGLPHRNHPSRRRVGA